MDVRIFSTQRIDKECDYIENEVYMPVRCGAVFDSRKSIIQGDNTGDHISEKRKSYCELTTQYWAWKNITADYYGFCHYRRYFSFNEKQYPADDWGSVILNYLDKSTRKQIIEDPDVIKAYVKQYDVITPVPVNLKSLHIKSVYEQYRTGPQLHIEDIDLVLDIIDEKYPELSSAAHDYINGTSLFLCNMFIMSRDIFFQYSAFLFNVLKEFERRADMTYYSEEGRRTPGHLGERLFGIFYTYLKQQDKYRFGELQMVTFSAPERQKTIKKFFDGESINIVLSSSEYFAPYCATTIQSLLRYRAATQKYDIVVLEQEMLEKTKNRLCSIVDGMDGVSLRTYNVRRLFSQYQLHICEHFSVETYFRLVIPEIMSEYSKVLYLDSDLIVQNDVAELFHTDINGYVAAAVLDVVGMGIVNGFNPDKVRYYKERVRMKDFRKQLNGGVLLLNLRSIREQYTSEELLRYAEYSHFDLADQDVFNSLFEGQIKWLDIAWNASNDEKETLRGYVATFAPEQYYKDYLTAIKRPKIIHYAGSIKPWHDPGYRMAEDFWNILRETPFYDIVVHRRIAENAQAFAACSSRQQAHNVGFFRRIADVLTPKGTKRREIFKKVLFKLIGKPYTTPYYMLGRS